uniref:Proteinase inhibitor n=1 Tax=Yersinia ruckeri TaxID=29486 RepID=A0A0A8VEV1_YERRU|nr:proteinase inhibitor [Yersinia ruckeri]
MGKPANVRCIHLSIDMRCGIFYSPQRPKVCASLQAQREMCHTHRQEALVYLIQLEAATAPF